VPLQDAKDYIAMSSGPKTVQFYDADHALNAKAGVDRDEFLHKKTQVSALTRLIATFPALSRYVLRNAAASRS
jgi:hypothetical protein